VLITNYRHYNITVIIGNQYLYSVPPLIRQCVTYFVTFKQNTKKGIQTIYDEYFQDFESYKECKDYIQRNTKDYSFIMANMREKLENKYYIGRCEMIKTDIKITY
jgi:hypothetical protein